MNSSKPALMANLHILFFIVTIILLSDVVTLSYAEEIPALQAQSIESGRGLMYMQGAETFGKGALTAGFYSFIMEKEVRLIDKNGIVSDKNDLPAVFALPVTFGLTDEVDISAALYGFHDGRGMLNQYDSGKGYGESISGLGSARIAAKIQLPLPQKSPIRIAGKFAAVLSSSKEQLGELNYRWSRTDTDVETSLYETVHLGKKVTMHFEQGYVLSGTTYYDDQMVLGGGIEFEVRPWWAVSCELISKTYLGKGPRSLIDAGNDPSHYYSAGAFPAIGDPRYVIDSTDDYGRDFFIVAPSMRFQLNSFLSFFLGGAINIADQKEAKEQFQVLAGLTFSTRIMSMIDTDRDGVRNHMDDEPRTPKGFPVDLSGRALDSDQDGIPDGKDREKNTPAGVSINDSGVGIDTDGDGVFDGIDIEPSTPHGCPVDKFGVALDGDRDGVPDGLDLEENTVIGAIVNSDGIALDLDGDDIPDGIDLENDSRKGALVDATGVSIDDDKDGVPNGIDKEPNTPEGLLVDKIGRALIRQDYSLFREGLIRLNSISYDGGTSEVPEDSIYILVEIGKIMVKYPSLRIQIEGHTDKTGEPAVNLRIARIRARKVLDEILKRYPDLTRERFRVVGFGSEKPIASNSTFQGRKANRRVEFVILENSD